MSLVIIRAHLSLVFRCAFASFVEVKIAFILGILRECTAVTVFQIFH